MKALQIEMEERTVPSWSHFLILHLLSEELGSDEDDIDEDGQECLEILAKQAGEDGDDEDWEEDDAEETALEEYSTVIDDEDNPVDEYQIFKAIFQSKSNHDIYTLHDKTVCVFEMSKNG